MATIHEKYQRRAIPAIAIALYAGVLLRAVAQDPKSLNVDVGNCVDLQKPEERLACFEAQVKAVQQRAAPASASDATATGTAPSGAAVTAASAAPSGGAVTAASAGAVAGVAAATKEASTDAAERIAPSTNAAGAVSPSVAPDVHSQTSASEPHSAGNSRGGERSPEQQPVEIVATVTELRPTVPNAYVITLDNGQVYRQAHPMPYPLRVGLVVRVRETNFGYRLSAPELNGQINVERVR
jgi:hypothetical protein